ncbi:MAG: haloacid dehalogenase-like hydrolase [Deltaproteobacteria bacterium]|nr:haloacid dehalogenase-like hydrolase [Deltaproteobacteria bacterium]
MNSSWPCWRSKIALCPVWVIWLVLLALPGCEKEKPPKPPAAADAVKPEPKPAPAQKTAGALSGAWEPAVRTSLEKLIAERGKGGAAYDAAKPPVAVFDFDNTCIRGDIGRAFFDFMVTSGKIQFDEAVFATLPADKRPAVEASWKAVQALPADKRADSRELRSLRKQMHQIYWSLCSGTESDKCFPWQVRFYAGHTPAEIEKMGAEVMDAELKRKMGSEPIRIDDQDASPAITSTGIRIHEEIKELMERLAGAGFDLWIVSAGPQWVVKGAAHHFPVPPEHVIGMRTRLVDGKLSAEMEPPATFRQGKVEAIEKHIQRKPVLCAGDSWSDAEMLDHAEHALLVDRGYLDLKKRAREKGWWVQPTFPVD